MRKRGVQGLDRHWYAKIHGKGKPGFHTNTEFNGALLESLEDVFYHDPRHET